MSSVKGTRYIALGFNELNDELDLFNELDVLNVFNELDFFKELNV